MWAVAQQRVPGVPTCPSASQKAAPSVGHVFPGRFLSTLLVPSPPTTANHKSLCCIGMQMEEDASGMVEPAPNPAPPALEPRADDATYDGGMDLCEPLVAGSPPEVRLCAPMDPRCVEAIWSCCVCVGMRAGGRVSHARGGHRVGRVGW